MGSLYFLSTLKAIVAGYRIVFFWNLNNFSPLSHDFKVWLEKSTVTLTTLPVYVTCCFYVTVFSMCSLFSFSEILIIMCCGEVLFWLCLLKVPYVLYLKIELSSFGNNFALISLNKTCWVIFQFLFIFY